MVNALTFGFGTTPLTELITEEAPIREGSTAPDIIIERVISLAGDGENDTDLVVLRNVGGQTADLTDWRLTDRDVNAADAYVFGQEGCEDQAILPPAIKVELRPRTEENPCGFDFSINFRDEINVVDAEGEVVSTVTWTESEEGTSFRIVADGSYARVPENLDIIETLEELGDYTALLRVLDHLNLTDDLKHRNNRSYTGVVILEPEAPVVDPQFPSNFGFARNRTAMPPSPTPSPSPEPLMEGIPRRGPYTLLAPNDEAFEDLRAQIAGAGNPPVSEEYMLELPELEDIVLYHVIGGAWTSEYLLNNTPIFTAKAVEVVPFTDGFMNEGMLRLHDACIDKPTPDAFECIEQIDFNKCYDPFMTNPLGAQWQGGFCERTCGRCTCDPRGGAPCADVTTIDVMASNGVIHTISRVLFPPPVFVKEILPPSEEGASGTGTTTGARRTGPDTGAVERPVLGVGFTVRGDNATEEEDEPTTTTETEDDDETTTATAEEDETTTDTEEDDETTIIADTELEAVTTNTDPELEAITTDTDTDEDETTTATATGRTRRSRRENSGR